MAAPAGHGPHGQRPKAMRVPSYIHSVLWKTCISLWGIYGVQAAVRDMQ
jgi:hypothetical protein